MGWSWLPGQRKLWTGLQLIGVRSDWWFQTAGSFLSPLCLWPKARRSREAGLQREQWLFLGNGGVLSWGTSHSLPPS